MKEPRYIDALKAGWDLAWHHKSLWVFGFFATLLGQMGVVELLSKSTMGAARLYDPSVWVYLWHTFSGLSVGEMFAQFNPAQWMAFVWLLVLLIGLVMAFILVAVVSQGAIVHSTSRYIARRGKFEDSSTSWHASSKHVWKLLGLNILRKIVIVLFVIFVMWGTINALITPSGWDLLLFLFLFLLAVLMGMILSFLLIYAVGYVVIEEAGFIESMRKAWRLFTNHWLVSFEIGFILLILNIVVLVLLLAGLYILFLPSLFMWSIAATVGSGTIFMIGLVIGLVLFMMYVVLIGTIFNVFTTATWTYLFTKMHKTGLVSHVVHLFRKK